MPRGAVHCFACLVIDRQFINSIKQTTWRGKTTITSPESARFVAKWDSRVHARFRELVYESCGIFEAAFSTCTAAHMRTSFTRWNFCYSVARKILQFRTTLYKVIFSCSTAAPFAEMTIHVFLTIELIFRTWIVIEQFPSDCGHTCFPKQRGR